MERLNDEEIENLTDREILLAFERTKRDYSLGLLNDRVTSRANILILETELRRRGYPIAS